MGLAERKVVAAIKESDYKTFEAKLKKLCGFDVNVSMDWATLENHENACWIWENNKHNEMMFNCVTQAFEAICVDQMGKDAVKEKLKEIKLVPTSGDLSFSNGILLVSNDLNGNGHYSADRIQSILEQGL